MTAGQKDPQRLPDLAAAQAAFAAFCRTIAALRDPKDGCPWDLEQTHATLRRYMIEEAYEAADAMATGEGPALCDELGDVLLQVVLNAQVAQDALQFTIVEVIQAIDSKMRRRHPHVFGDAVAKAAVATAGAVRSAWEVIKEKEKAADLKPAATKPTFAEAEKTTPASLQAAKIGKLAAKIHFDWDNVQEVFAQVQSEVSELAVEIDAKAKTAILAEEIGDIYFSLAQLCRHLHLDPEVVAVDANRKFMRRFAQLEQIAGGRGLKVADATREQLEALWKMVKAQERS